MIGVQVGEFISSGTFGDIHRGRYNGEDVAVKVLRLDGSKNSLIAREIEGAGSG